MDNSEWIGIDFDGTLAHYDVWRGIYHTGKPIAPMVRLARELIKLGYSVRIFTARADEGKDAIDIIQRWCAVHIGRELPVTNHKDRFCIAILDDRCASIEQNTGRIIGGKRGFENLARIIGA